MKISNNKMYIFLVCLLLFTTTCIYGGTEHDFDCTAQETNGESPLWINNGGILLILIGLFVMFWSLAIVCEEYFVPALHVLCSQLQISDDIAGATFMAAGASSPELFISFLGLFVQKSTIGVGTLLGSEIFNHMIICAGSIFYAKDGVLNLNSSIFTRECIGYFVSLVALLFVVKSDFIVSIEHSFDSSNHHKCLIVYWYGPIILVLIYCLYILFLRYFEKILLFLKPNSKLNARRQSEFIQDPITFKWYKKSELSSEPNSPVMFNENSNPLNSIEDPPVIETGIELNKSSKTKKTLKPIEISIAIKKNNDVLNIDSRETISIKVIKHSLLLEAPKPTIRTEENINNNFITIHDNFTLGYHYFVYPIKYLMFHSIPDVRSHPSMEIYYLRSIALSAFWLAILSYVMLIFCSILGDWMEITPLQMGLTLSAIGTSFPNLWSSMIVAREGLGDMAVSNALGSNTFNTCIGLGLPLFLFQAFNLHENNYSQMTNGGIDILILLLILILLIFYTMIALSDWKMKTWMAYVFIAIYFVTILLTLYLATIAENEAL